MQEDLENGSSDQQNEKALQAWKELGLTQEVAEAALSLSWERPTDIQLQAIPKVVQGNDVIGLAQTGSGKTGAFALPILQDLLQTKKRFYALVLSPTRELALQIHDQFIALGASIGLLSAALVGGIDMMQQAVALARRPHVLVGTPGRLVDHLTNTKGFNLKSIGHLVLDEADKLLDMDFEAEINQILMVCPKQRVTQLFSATMTDKVQKLHRACLRDPIRVEVSHKYETVATLRQQYMFIPAKDKDAYLIYLLTEMSGQTCIVFTRTCEDARKVALTMRNLGVASVPIHGQMTQDKRLAALNQFKSKSCDVLVATNVACRGLDIPDVSVVINYDIPHNPKEYVHRVGRTARAGRSGRSVSMVTQYDVELLQRIEGVTKMRMDEYGVDDEMVRMMKERVGEAQSLAGLAIREAMDKKGKRKGARRGGRSGGAVDDRLMKGMGAKQKGFKVMKKARA